MNENKKLVPIRRFKEFQNSDDWEQRKLGDLITSFSGGTPSAGNKLYYGGTIPFIRSGEISSEQTELFLTEEGLNNSSAKLVDQGDILYALYGATSGEVSISHISGAINQAILALKPVENYNSYFIMQWLRKEKENIIRTYLQGGQGNLSGNIVKELIVTIPTNKAEQDIIGTYFLNFDNLITLHQRKLEKMKALKAAYLYEMFPVEGERKPKRRFRGFTNAWEQRKYSEVIDLLSGQDFSPYEYTDEEIGMPYLTGASCIENGHTTAVRWTEKPRCIVEQGDTVLVCKGSGYGAIATVDQEKAHIARQFMALKVKKSLLNIHFNYWLLNSVVENIKMDARGLIVGIARDTVLQQDVVIPAFEEQAKIGDYFQILDNLITLHQHKLEKLQIIKNAYLNEMFVGGER